MRGKGATISVGDREYCIKIANLVSQVFEAERMVTRVGSYHRNCFSCIECNKKLDSMDVCEGPDSEIYCKNCYSMEYGTKARSNPRAAGLRRRAMSVPKLFSNQDDMLARSTVETWVIKAESGDPVRSICVLRPAMSREGLPTKTCF